MVSETKGHVHTNKRVALGLLRSYVKFVADDG
jgi:hypothetical protein